MDVEEKLTILYDLLVDNFSVLEAELKDLIANPDRIKDTNRFASLLSDLKNPTFIEPLLYSISSADKTDTWLTDFLYAAINLLDESSVNDTFDTPENLIDKLQDWILNDEGELAWKAAALLKFNESEIAEKIQLKKLEERDVFFLTHAECIVGLLRYDKDKHMPLIEQIANDEMRDDELREFCKKKIKKYR